MAKRKRPGKPAESTKTRTQLNNARKRAAKKRAKQQAKLVDPSLVFIQNPLGAPTVVRAKGWFADLGKKLPLRLGPLEGWRTSAKLAVRASGASGVKIGLFVPKSHDVVPISGCAAHHASINAALEAISTACIAARIRGYDEDKGEGDLRYVKLEVQRSSELVQVTLVWHASSPEEAGKPLRQLLTALQQHELWYSIWANFHAADKHTSRILAFEKEAWVQLAGRKRWLREALQRSAVPYHCELCFPPFVFRQANLCAFERIVSAVRRFVPFGSVVVELYAGVGTIGLHLADVAGSLVCSDENPFNRACFRRSVKSLPPDLQEQLRELAWKLEGQKHDLQLLRITGGSKIAECNMMAEEEQNLTEEVERLKQALERAESEARAVHAADGDSLPIDLVLPRRLRKLQEGSRRWEDLIQFRQGRADELRKEASTTELRNEFFRSRAMALQQEAARLRLASRKAAETLAVAKDSKCHGCSGNGQEDVRWAQRCRRYAFFLPMLSSFLTSLWRKLSYVSGDAASQVDSIPTADVLIVDPPRKGMEDEVLDALARRPKRKSVKPCRLIYVSCGFPAFCRDAEKLMQHGWTVLHAEGFVLFPGSDRTILRRSASSKEPERRAPSKTEWCSLALVTAVPQQREAAPAPSRLTHIKADFEKGIPNPASLLLAMAWEVVGGGDKGGILVRSGQATSSDQLSERLSTGARVEELDLVGERLHYKLVSGTGPAEGWVSLSLKDKPLLQRVGEKAKPDVKDAGDLREGDYYVTLGILFKKLGTDPEKASITKLKRSVGSVVHTTGKVWRGSGGGYWAELDMSSGDSGAGEKSGYVMIDASGFGTPGPCLQKASKEDGPILLLKAKPKPGSEVKAWDDGSLDKEFLVLSKTTIAEVRVILAMLFKIAKSESITVLSKDGGQLTPETNVGEAGFRSGDDCAFEHSEGAPLRLVVMSPLEEGVKLTDLDIKNDWTVGQVRKLLCSITGLKESSMIMARGKMGERVGEDAQLNLSHLVADCGYKEGDEIGFIYMGDTEGDLKAFLAKN
eukprot:s6565_g3.t2